MYLHLLLTSVFGCFVFVTVILGSLGRLTVSWRSSSKGMAGLGATYNQLKGCNNNQKQKNILSDAVYNVLPPRPELPSIHILGKLKIFKKPERCNKHLCFRGKSKYQLQTPKRSGSYEETESLTALYCLFHSFLKTPKFFRSQSSGNASTTMSF